MAGAVKDLRSMPLYEIIGAPLVAVVQAETQATRATVEYIQQVGFAAGEGDTETRLGKLRMAEFRYVKPDENGAPAEFLAQVPVLSLVPIPGVRVKRAKVTFTAKITDAYSEETGGTTSGSGATGDGATAVRRAKTQWLKPSLTQFRGGLAPASKRNEQLRGAYELNIEIEMEQLPIAAGLEKVLQTLDQAIRDDEISGGNT